jgi:hypothetical protein
MAKLAEIKKAINELPAKEYKVLKKWFWDKEQQIWDDQIKKDCELGLLNLLVKEAEEESNSGKLANL